jgi:outer membrane receptor protein involved in Fe transport
LHPNQASKNIMRVLLFCAILLVNVCSWSQAGIISGEVTLESTESAAGATVTLGGSTQTTIVSDSGTFEFNAVPYGKYTLIITSLESKPHSTSITLDAPRKSFKISLERVDSNVLEHVSISKVSAKKEIVDKGFAVNVIETKDAALRNLQTNDLLDRSVGVRIRQNGGLGASVDYNLNGMSGNSIRIFIDGIPITTYGPSFNLNSIPPALIDRIEVFKGVIPSHLADDALGGAINVVLKKTARNLLSASVSYGSFNTVQSNLSASYRADSGLTVKASAFQNYSDNDYEVWGKFVYNILPNGREEHIRAKRFNDMYRSFGGRIEAGYTNVAWADQFFIGYNRSYDYNQIQHGLFMTKPYMGRFSESEAQVLNLTYAKKNFITNGLEFTLNGVYSQRNEVINDTVKWNYNWEGKRALGLYGEPTLAPGGAQQGAPTINHIDRNIFSIRAGLAYEIADNHKVVFSTMYNIVDREDNDEMKSALERAFMETRDLQKTVSSLAYELEAFDKKLRASVFGKYYEQRIEKRDPRLISQNGQTTVTEDVYTKTSNTLGYGAAASYYLTPQIMLISSAEKAVRMPAENEIFGSPGENIIGSAGINPEISNNLNIGLRVGPFTAAKHSLTLAGSTFWRNTEDKIIRATSAHLNDAIEALPYENLGKTQAVGFEASLDYSYNKDLLVSLNMSRFNSLFKVKYDKNGQVLTHYNRQLPNEPYLNFNGNVQYTLHNLLQQNAGINMYYSLGYVHPFYTTWLEDDRARTPAQLAQDLGISYAFPNKQFVLSFDARNIFDKQIYDNYAVQKPGRAFYLKLNYTLNNF